MTFADKFRRRVKHVSVEYVLGSPIGAHNGMSDVLFIPEAKLGDVLIHTYGGDDLTFLDVRAARVDTEDGRVLVRFFNTGEQELRHAHPITLHFLIVKGLDAS